MPFNSRLAKYLIILSLVVGFYSCNRKTIEDLPPGKTSLTVKEILESFHDPIKDSDTVDHASAISENSFINSTAFNQKGEVIRRSRFNSKGNLESKITFAYDEQSNNIEIVYYDPFGSMLSKKINKFDSANKLIKSSEFDSEGKKVIGKESVSFDDAGNRIISSYKVKSRDFVKISESIFDRNERNIENNFYADLNLQSKEVISYDSIGNRIEIIQYNLLKKEQINTRYKYDSLKNVIEIAVFKNNLVVSKTIFRYNEKGDVSATFNYGLSGNLRVQKEHLYEYDVAGNWTKQVIMVNKRPTSVILHDIEYWSE